MKTVLYKYTLPPPLLIERSVCDVRQLRLHDIGVDGFLVGG